MGHFGQWLTPSTSCTNLVCLYYLHHLRHHQHLQLDAQLIGKPIVSDSLLEYNLDFNALSGRYQQNKDVEFYIEKMPLASMRDTILSISFLKKDKYIFMVILTFTEKSTDKFDQTLLLKLLTNTGKV